MKYGQRNIQHFRTGAPSSRRVSDDFECVLEFLQREQPEVLGRANIPEATRQKLAKFAAGACSEDDREEVKRLLQTEPELLSALAEEVRSLRKAEQ